MKVGLADANANNNFFQSSYVFTVVRMKYIYEHNNSNCYVINYEYTQ